MPNKSKWFCIATEGATADGRTIERAWIEQMAASYDPKVYRACINLEHFRGIFPDGPFRNYGFVDALKAAENDAGKKQLLAQISPTDELVGMVKSAQKVFTSIEVNPKFADTGKAYLVGLAVTDNPASLGVEMLEFAARHPEANPFAKRKLDPGNLFTAAAEAAIEFEHDSEKPRGGVLAKVRAMFAKRQASEDARYSDLAAAIEEVAEHGEAQSAQTAQRFEKVDGDVKKNAQDIAAMGERLEALENAFNTTAPQRRNRPPAAGGNDVLTDF
jgi:hypothetical protein